MGVGFQGVFERQTQFMKERLVSPGGFWSPIRDKITTDKKTILGWNFLANWLAGVALIYGMTFGIGKLIFGDLITGGILLFIAGVGFLIELVDLGGRRLLEGHRIEALLSY